MPRKLGYRPAAALRTSRKLGDLHALACPSAPCRHTEAVRKSREFRDGWQAGIEEQLVTLHTSFEYREIYTSLTCTSTSRAINAILYVFHGAHLLGLACREGGRAARKRDAWRRHSRLCALASRTRPEYSNGGAAPGELATSQCVLAGRGTTMRTVH